MAAAVVQSNSATSVTNGGTLALGSNVTAGNRIVINFVHDYAGFNPAPTATGYTFVRDDYVDQRGKRGYSFSAPIASSGSAPTVTFGMSGGTIYGLLMMEVSGLDGTTWYGGNSGAAPSASPFNYGTVTPTVDGSLVLAMGYYSGGGSSFGAITSFTQPLNSNGVTVQHYIQPTAASISPNGTHPDPSNVSAYVFYYNAAAGGGGGSAPRRRAVISSRRSKVPVRRSIVLTGASIITGAPVVDPTPVRFNPTRGPTIAFAPTRGAPVRFNPTFSSD